MIGKTKKEEQLSKNKIKINIVYKDIFNSIDETFDKVKEDKSLSQIRSNDVKWIKHYMDTLYKYGKKCKNHIVELGVNKVLSSWAWAKSRPKKITLCDTELFNRGGVWLDSFNDLCSKEGIKIIQENKSSLDIKLENIDLLFIDSLHTCDHCTKELKLHSPYVKKYIIFHDTILKGSDVRKAVMNFLEENNKWKIVEELTSNPGLIIIGKGKYE